MTVPPLFNQIKNEFEDRFDSIKLSEASLKAYHDLCNLYKIESDDLIDHIQAELLKNSLADPNAESFISDVQTKMQKKASQQIQSKRQTQALNSSRVSKGGRKKGGKRQRGTTINSVKADAPPPHDDTFSSAVSQLEQSYAAYRDRKNRGTVDQSFGSFESQNTASKRGGMYGTALKLKVRNTTTGVGNSKTLYMYDNMNQKSDLLADRTLELGEALKVVIEKESSGKPDQQESSNVTTNPDEAQNADADNDRMEDVNDKPQNSSPDQSIEYQNFGIVTGSEALYLGRVLCESITGLSKLNLNSVLLEGFIDDEHNKSMIYKLDLSDYAVRNAVSLFPGQVVVVQGLLSVRGVLKVSKMYTDVALRPKPIRFDSPLALESQAPTSSSSSTAKHHINMMIACGPFTPSTNISYEPFADLLQVVRRNEPDLLILLGPFVDSTQKLIGSPELDETYDNLFERTIVRPLQTTLPQNTKAILIPALHDAHHDFVYPQPAFDRRAYSISSSQVETFSNPSLFSVEEFGGLTVGASSHLVLSQLQRLQFSSQMPKDAYTQLASHLTQQHSFYPIMMNTNHVPLDYSHSRHCLDWNGETPHVLVVPHKEACARFLENGTLVVSPRALTKSETGGSYVELHISLKEDESELSETNISVRVLNI
mmetsp:Transcript_8921/g.32923  ORF Transcript_8921/g.32923 Transcript_8921/m.32923 type:complete len:654 (-) Transcript_8921:36-1997(-)